MFKLLMYLITFLILPCGSCQSSPEKEAAPKVKKTDMKANAKFDFIRYEVGNPNFEGKTIVEVLTGGGTTVSFLQGKKEEKYEGAIPAADLKSFYQLLETNNPCALKPSTKPGTPGTAIIKITFSESGTVCSSRNWNDEQWENEKLKKWVVYFNTLASQVSNGKVEY